MDFDLIKKIIAKEKAKIVIVENGEPIIIISDFKEYFSSEKNTPQPKQTSITQEQEKDIIFAQAKKEEKIFLPKEEKDKELTIDDLPL